MRLIFARRSHLQCNGKTSLNDLCRTLGFPGKPDDIDGSEVERYVREGLIESSEYIANSMWVPPSGHLFRGRLSRAKFEASEANLFVFVQERLESKPHLGHLLGARALGRHPSRTRRV
jgi:hypothetical protein